MVPIHHTAMFDHPEFYRPVADAPERIAELAAEAEVTLGVLEPGEWADAGRQGRRPGLT